VAYVAEASFEKGVPNCPSTPSWCCLIRSSLARSFSKSYTAGGRIIVLIGVPRRIVFVTGVFSQISAKRWY
jgi:hypothetical protein